MYDEVDSSYGKKAHTMTVVSTQSEGRSPKKLKACATASDTG